MNNQLIPEPIGKSSSALFASARYLWGPGGEIPVCWESVSPTPEDERYRKAIQDAITETWQQALDLPIVPPNKRFQFKGWAKCAPDSKGIRIQTHPSPYRANVTGNGRELDGKRDGMNLELPAPMSQCTAEFLGIPGPVSASDLKKICETSELFLPDTRAAIHEFGHALGLLHEQQRLDTPQSCLDSPEVKYDPDPSQSAKLGPADGLLRMGPWDPASIMNYCSARPSYKMGDPIPVPQLSEWDKLGVRALYYQEYFNLKCISDERAAATVAQGMAKGQAPSVDTSTQMKSLPTEQVSTGPLKPLAAPAK